jgi:putative transposase
MRPGPRIKTPHVQIPYKELRKLNPEAARRAVLEYLKASGHNVAETARLFGINRPVVYDILRKEGEGDLGDRSKTPRRQPRKTRRRVENQVIEAKNRTHLGSRRLAIYLAKYEKLSLPWPTVRNVLRRNKHRLAHRHPSRRPAEKREFVDWYSAKPFEIVQVDLKYIRDLKALTHHQIRHLDRYRVPNFQWGALDVTSRFKLIAYSRERSWTNGLCFYLWVIAWLRAHGVRCQIVFTVDHGEEFGGKSWLKIAELKRLIRPFGCRLIQNHKGHCEENAHLERSHRTDDDEFYIPRAFHLKGEQDLLREALGYNYYYNNVREHSALDYQTPFAYLKSQMPSLDDGIRYVVPVILDDISVQLGPWSGYNVLVQNPDTERTAPVPPVLSAFRNITQKVMHSARG